MAELVVALLAFVLVALALTVLGGGRPAPGEEPARRAARRLPRPPSGRPPLWPWLAGAALAAALHLGWGMMLWIAASIGVLLGAALTILARLVAARRVTRLEFQLADGIDLMVSTLRAGGGLSDALIGAARECGEPFRSLLQELVERIRLGESPKAALADLERRVPLESFRLFTFTLAAHWEGGGSLATTLSDVGRTIRDRVHVTRRVRSQAIETQVSVAGVLVVTYGLALLMWNNYPERLDTFASSEIGSMFIAFSILLQGIGIVWIASLTRVEI